MNAAAAGRMCIKPRPVATIGEVPDRRGLSARCRSSVVEHSLGKGEVDSSILSGSTTKAHKNQDLGGEPLPCPPRFEREQDGNSPTGSGENPGTAFHDRSTFPLVVAEWNRNAREVVRVALDFYSGRYTVNARVWYHGDDGLRPGKTGITLSVKHLPALADALARAERRARELGLIEEGGAQ